MASPVDALRNIMMRNVITARPSESLQHIQRLMITRGIGRVVITDGARRPVGVVTEMDLVGFLLKDRTDRGIDQIAASEAMSKRPVAVPSSMPIPSAAKTALSKGISSLIVVGGENKLEGIVTKTDFCLYYGSKYSGVHKVRDFMTKRAVTVRPSHSIFRVAEIMSERKISRVMVTDGKLEGIITLSDLAAASAIFNPKSVILGRKPVLLKGMIVRSSGVSLLTARDIMTSNPITVQQDADLASAAKLMTTHGISGLPVSDEGATLVGIVTKTDITRAISTLRQEFVQ